MDENDARKMLKKVGVSDLMRRAGIIPQIAPKSHTHGILTYKVWIELDRWGMIDYEDLIIYSVNAIPDLQICGGCHDQYVKQVFNRNTRLNVRFWNCVENVPCIWCGENCRDWIPF